MFPNLSLARQWTGLSKLGYFVSSALPFGAVAAVNQFNWIGEDLKAVATRLLWLPVTSFYDNFAQCDRSVTAEFGHLLLEALCSATGWSFSTKAHKRRPFSASFEALGLCFTCRSRTLRREGMS
eukprot:6348278-Amphidinium_carterae.2